MPPSVYFASKSYHSAPWVDDLARERRLGLRVADHRALDLAPVAMRLDDHARVVAKRQLDRVVELLLGRHDARDADARAQARRLDPDRHAHRRRLLAPARLAHLAEVHLREPVMGEEALADELVHRDRGREHARPRVRDVEAFEEPLDRAVLAERAVEHGEGDVGAEQAAGRAQLDLLAVGEPAAVALDQDADDLVARLLEPGRDRLARAERDVVLRGAPAVR